MLEKWMGRLEGQKRCFRRSLAATEGRNLDRLRASGFDLAACLGLVIIPSAGFAGAWDTAADEAADFLRLLGSASARCGDPARTYLHLLPAPILWALLFAGLERCPAARAETERVRNACPLPRLFTALDRLPGSPPSVCFAAGVLATLAAPPTAGTWIERARRQAHCHGARGFADLFSQLVTDH
jgi:hypothetical protein